MRRLLTKAAVFLLFCILIQSSKGGSILVAKGWSPKEIVGLCLSVAVQEQPVIRPLVSAACRHVAQVDWSKPGLLYSVLPVSGIVPAVSMTSSAKHVPKVEKAEVSAPAPVVAIYNTHTGETYAATDGIERVAGRGGVVKVAAVLERELRRHGIIVLRSEKIHDSRYAASYLESEKTVREIIYANPEIAALFDVHRDSNQPRGTVTAKVNGREAARVLIVVGSDARQPFPNWRQNLAFAQRIAERSEALYPGLCIGVRVKEGRYNQFLHPRALLIEIGGVNNSLEEAEAAAELFARVLADVLWREREDTRVLRKDRNGTLEDTILAG
ncbi:MAG: stage II sporulation protein P [Bacillota bacterium]